MRIGIDLGGTNVRVGVVSDGRILMKISESCKADKSEEETVEHIKSLVRRVMNSNIRGIGVGVPSVVDAERGIVYNAANIPSWKEVHLKEMLEKEFKIPVVVNNDCNCFAFGERYFGEGTTFHNIVCVAIGTGVGAGIIINDELYGGSNTGAGEIGSLPYLQHDYEYYCSSHFFSKVHGITGKEAFDRAMQGDEQALALWDEFGEHIGNLMNVVLFTYDPQAIIIGGGIAKSFDLFSGKMYETIAKFPYPETVKRLKIVLSQKEDINLLGASALVR
ncbi:ROK family protein [Dysgonomonas sp. ZJ709]|uniref:ROK family protein n=1 Tax=Dysgonomonas sp. ZJ709 TaxID=2709797 RepID=UPI0013ED19F3|nr:ROK family protein [Dysgonomonas sp. ZJ709]